MSSYPSWRYHANQPAVIVSDPGHEQAVAPAAAGWVHSPADVDRRPVAEPVKTPDPLPVAKGRPAKPKDLP